MPIPSHQIHNMLNTYARRLKKKRLQKSGDTSESTRSFAEKRRLIVNQITADIAKKLILKKSSGETSSPSKNKPELASQPDSAFFYHTIEGQDQKIKKSLKLQDPDFLIKQVESILGDTSIS